jgi:septum formation protein
MTPPQVALHLAIAKADAVAEQFPNDLILAADTVVAIGDQPLGKPADAEQAKWMLTLLSGSTHHVVTGVSIVCRQSNHRATATVSSQVSFRPLSEKDIDAYVQTNAWEGKAGGYGLQNNDHFVLRAEGCQTNIVGLPMTTTIKLLKEAGHNFLTPSPGTSGRGLG